MEKKLLENYIGKQVMIATTNDYTLKGCLQYNDTKNYPEDMYMVSTETDYTYFINPENIENIVIWEQH